MTLTITVAVSVCEEGEGHPWLFSPLPVGVAVEILWPLTSGSCEERKVKVAWRSGKPDCPTQVSAQKAGLPED